MADLKKLWDRMDRPQRFAAVVILLCFPATFFLNGTYGWLPNVVAGGVLAVVLPMRLGRAAGMLQAASASMKFGEVNPDAAYDVRKAISAVVFFSLLAMLGVGFWRALWRTERADA